MKKVFKVLDLFAGTQSVRKALEWMFQVLIWKEDNGVWYGLNDKQEKVVEYIGIDIISPEEKNIHLNLAQDNIVNRLKGCGGVLPTGWYPDFIWASPLYTTFSRAAAVHGGTLSYELGPNNEVNIRKDFSYIKHKRYIHKIGDRSWRLEQQVKGHLGLDLIANTKKIVEHFQVPYAIENPANALTRYLFEDYERTVTHYCQYGFDYKKATAIYTNIDKGLELKKCNHKKHDKVMSGWKSVDGKEQTKGSNKDRSIVPQPLIVEIIKQQMIGEDIW